MKIEMSADEFACLMGPHAELQKEVLRLTAEVARLESSQGQARSEGTVNLINVLTNVCSQLANGNKINAIKLVREYTSCGLREAKDIVEGTYSGPGIVRAI